MWTIWIAVECAGVSPRYPIIYADPPWRFTTYSDKGKDRAPEQHYDTMSISDIAALPVESWAADDCVLFMWVYQPMLREAFTLFDAWGFTFKTVAYFWVKITGGQDRLFYAVEDVRKGLGYHTRAGAEQCWLATRGKGYSRLSKGEGQVLFSPPRQHSRKPDEIAESIVRLVGDVPRLEMFARAPRPGWSVWGNETEKFQAIA
jgi:N6-adenosine-specific RNA methylase IME4